MVIYHESEKDFAFRVSNLEWHTYTLALNFLMCFSQEEKVLTVFQIIGNRDVRKLRGRPENNLLVVAVVFCIFTGKDKAI